MNNVITFGHISLGCQNDQTVHFFARWRTSRSQEVSCEDLELFWATRMTRTSKSAVNNWGPWWLWTVRRLGPWHWSRPHIHCAHWHSTPRMTGRSCRDWLLYLAVQGEICWRYRPKYSYIVYFTLSQSCPLSLFTYLYPHLTKTDTDEALEIETLIQYLCDSRM